MVEILCVLVIVFVLSAISTPVITGALQSAKESSSQQRMRQLSLALLAYRSDYDGNASGNASQMGLPTMEILLLTSGMMIAKERELWKSPCAQHPDSPIGFTNFNYYPDDDGQWIRYTNEKGDGSVMMSDFNCNPASLPIGAVFSTKRIPFVRLDGSTGLKTRTGSPQAYWDWF